jgi:hypothetical protein
MKKVLIVCTFACYLLALCSSFTAVFGAGEHPKLSSAQLDVSSLTQGVGGQLAINTYVQVNGTC